MSKMPAFGLESYVRRTASDGKGLQMMRCRFAATLPRRRPSWNGAAIGGRAALGRGYEEPITRRWLRRRQGARRPAQSDLTSERLIRDDGTEAHDRRDVALQTYRDRQGD